MTPPNVCGLIETAELLNVSRERVRQLRAAGKLPEPAQLASGPVWDRAELQAFRLDRIASQQGRNGKRGAALSRYRATGSIAAAARSVGMGSSTVRGWLRDLGEPLPRDR